jgi:2-dehydropantoate 2-reductase
MSATPETRTPRPAPLSVAVVGVGPVGAVAAAYLARAGHRVAVADIDATHIAAIAKDGITVAGVREAHGKPVRAVTRIAELAGAAWDYVIVSTKASLLERVMPEVMQVAGASAVVASLQNGLDTEVAVAKHAGPDRTVRAILNYAGGRTAPGRIQMMFFTGHNMIGAASPAGEAAARKLAETLTAAGLESDYTPDIRRFEWEKTILNAAMSPLCALTNLTMRECVESPPVIALSRTLIEEGIAVAKADGFTWDPGFRDYCLGYLGKAGHHRASMWVDASNHAPTEIRFLNGRIADIGDARGVPAPTHRVITTLVGGLEQSWTSPHK